ncbi:MAG: phytanoyl-CoA dioxygenase family protein [Pirellulales bacterium]
MYEYLKQLEDNGIVIIQNCIPSEKLRPMQAAFDARLLRLRWNDFDGYEKTEPYRHMVQDVLTLEQGFVDVATDPIVCDIIHAYVGPEFQLVEAKGWKTLPIKKDFHGWHGDAWYDQSKTTEIPREVKLAVYLSDVKTGAFNYIKGSHRKEHPRTYRATEIGVASSNDIVEAVGPAGTGILFDTSGMHRQGIPVLEPRSAIFLNYHDPGIPLQQEDIDYYRYHPLLLNAAFLGNLSPQDQRILGFGDKRNYRPAFQRADNYNTFQKVSCIIHGGSLRERILRKRVLGKLWRTLGF